MTYLRFALPLVVLVGLLSLYVLWQRAEVRADALDASLRAEQTENKRLTLRNTDLETEAIERLVDATAIEKMAKDMNDAVDAIPAAQQGAAPSPATVALGCVRLRAAGATSDAFKRICGAR